MADKNRYATLNNGLKMPMIGYGTWLSEDKDKLKTCVKHAVQESGYRHIDTASVYGNEDVIGEALAEVIEGGVAREDLFITTKLWRDDYELDAIEPALRASLDKLKLDYVDLYLIHWTFPIMDHEATPIKAKSPPVHKIWEVLEGLVDQGLIKSIGVSNCTVSVLANVMAGARIQPVVNQVEMHPYNQQPEFLEFHKKCGVQVTAYSPLGNPGFVGEGHVKVIEHEVIKSVADAHSASPA